MEVHQRAMAGVCSGSGPYFSASSRSRPCGDQRYGPVHAPFYPMQAVTTYRGPMQGPGPVQCPPHAQQSQPQPHPLRACSRHQESQQQQRQQQRLAVARSRMPYYSEQPNKPSPLGVDVPLSHDSTSWLSQSLSSLARNAGKPSIAALKSSTERQPALPHPILLDTHSENNDDDREDGNFYNFPFIDEAATMGMSRPPRETRRRSSWRTAITGGARAAIQTPAQRHGCRPLQLEPVLSAGAISEGSDTHAKPSAFTTTGTARGATAVSEGDRCGRTGNNGVDGDENEDDEAAAYLLWTVLPTPAPPTKARTKANCTDAASPSCGPSDGDGVTICVGVEHRALGEDSRGDSTTLSAWRGDPSGSSLLDLYGYAFSASQMHSPQPLPAQHQPQRETSCGRLSSRYGGSDATASGARSPGLYRLMSTRSDDSMEELFEQLLTLPSNDLATRSHTGGASGHGGGAVAAAAEAPSAAVLGSTATAAAAASGVPTDYGSAFPCPARATPERRQHPYQEQYLRMREEQQQLASTAGRKKTPNFYPYAHTGPASGKAMRRDVPLPPPLSVELLVEQIKTH